VRPGVASGLGLHARTSPPPPPDRRVGSMRAALLFTPAPFNIKVTHRLTRPSRQRQRRSRVRTPRAAILNDLAVSSIAAAAASGGLYGLQRATSAGLLSSKLNRKLVHTATGPLLLSLWPFYSADPSGKYVAAAVPLLFMGRLVYSASQGSSLAASIARGKDLTEVLRGPLIYVSIILAVTLLSWKTSTACVAVSQLAVGDGLSDIVGRRFGKGTEWAFRGNQGAKTVVGSSAFVAGAFFGSASLLSWFHAAGILSANADGGAWSIVDRLPSLLCISLCCAAVEALFEEVDDNISIPLTASLLALLLNV
jgi:dolichol kinase